jgi:hypothetical protein
MEDLDPARVSSGKAEAEAALARATEEVRADNLVRTNLASQKIGGQTCGSEKGKGKAYERPFAACQPNFAKGAFVEIRIIYIWCSKMLIEPQ